MPELPDVQLLYLNALTENFAEERIETFELRSPFLLRSYEPRLEEVLACLNPTSRRPPSVLLLGRIYLAPEPASDGI